VRGVGNANGGVVAIELNWFACIAGIVDLFRRFKSVCGICYIANRPPLENTGSVFQIQLEVT